MLSAAAIVVPCLSTLVSDYGKVLFRIIFVLWCHDGLPVLDILPGSVNQKGTVMGILRSLGALARAMGPIVASTGKDALAIIVFVTNLFYILVHDTFYFFLPYSLLGCWSRDLLFSLISILHCTSGSAKPKLELEGGVSATKTWKTTTEVFYERLVLFSAILSILWKALPETYFGMSVNKNEPFVFCHVGHPLKHSLKMTDEL